MEEVVDNRERARFELALDGHIAELVYRVEGNRLILVHTEVPDELAGRGLGGRLVRASVGRAAREGLTIVPLCPFAQRWIGDHPGDIGGVEVDGGSGDH
jgi:hypothetical protein